MTILTYRGDAPAVAKALVVSKPQNYVQGEIELVINNKRIIYPSWNTQALADAWNNAGYPETQLITCTAISSLAGQYGLGSEEALRFDSVVAGEDFFLKAYINDATKTNEIQTLVFSPKPSGGTFTITFDGQTTSAITFVDDDPSTTTANIQAALEALSNIAVGDVLVTAEGTYSYRVQFKGAYLAEDVPQMTADGTNLTGGDVSVSVAISVLGVLPVNEIQTLGLPTTPTGGTFTLSFGGQTTTAIAYNANAATVQAALEALSSIGSGNVSCTGGALPGTDIAITFHGDLASSAQDLITGNGSLLTGTTTNIISPSTIQTGSSGTNWIERYGSASSLVGKTVKWRVYTDWSTYTESAAVAYDAGNAALKAALVGMSLLYREDAGFYTAVNAAYTIQSADINITGDLTTLVTGVGAAGGILVEYTGALASRYWTRTDGTYSYVAIYLVDSDGNLLNPNTLNNNYNYQHASNHMEIQQYGITDITVQGTYALTVYDSLAVSHVTANINYSETDPLIIAAIINAALGGNYVSVTTSYSSGTGSLTVRLYYYNYGYQTADIALLSVGGGDIGVSRTQAGDPGTSQIQSVLFSYTEDVTAGTFTITYAGQITAAIAYNASDVAIQTALEALSNITAGDIIVQGGYGAPWQNGFSVIWLPSLGNPSLLVVDSTSLKNSLAVADTYVGGGVAIEVTEIIRNAGPECFDDKYNYDPPQVPSDGDAIQFEFGQDNCKWGILQRDTFTVDSASTNTLLLSTERPLFQDGQKLRVRTTGTIPGGLTANSAYYVINSDGTGRFQLSSTSGGTAIDITSAGSGVHTIELHLLSLTKPAKFSFSIGLPRNNSGFEEYRPKYLSAAIDTITLGEREGSDSSLVRIDLDTTQSDITVYNTASPQEAGIGAAGFLINNASTPITCYGGNVGIGLFLDEPSEVEAVKLFDTILVSIGGLTCTSITADKGSSLKGRFIPSGEVRIGV